MLMLLDEQPRHGDELIRLVEDRFLGMYTPSAGTVYPRLQSLEDEGLVEHEEVDGKKVYRLTEAGRRELAERKAELEELQARAVKSARRLADTVGSELLDSAREIRRAMRDLRREERRASRGDRDFRTREGSRPGRHQDEDSGPDRDRHPDEEGRPGQGLAWRALRADLDAFSVDVMSAARGRPLDRKTLNAVRDTLLDARESVITALRAASAADRGPDAGTAPPSEQPGPDEDAGFA